MLSDTKFSASGQFFQGRDISWIGILACLGQFWLWFMFEAILLPNWLRIHVKWCNLPAWLFCHHEIELMPLICLQTRGVMVSHYSEATLLHLLISGDAFGIVLFAWSWGILIFKFIGAILLFTFIFYLSNYGDKHKLYTLSCACYYDMLKSFCVLGLRGIHCWSFSIVSW